MCPDRRTTHVSELFFFFQAEDGIRDYKVTGVQTCALPISRRAPHGDRRRLRPDLSPCPQEARRGAVARGLARYGWRDAGAGGGPGPARGVPQDRKSTRLNSSHLVISYAVFCLKTNKPSYYS